MWGKIFGALLGIGIGMLLSLDPALVAGLAAVGLALGHFVVDREVALTKADAPPSADELLGGSPRARAAAKRVVRKPPPRPLKRVDADQEQLATLLCPLFIEVARCDGPVVQLEVRVIREFFELQLKFDEPAMEVVRVRLKESLAATPGDVEVLAKAARGAVKPADRLAVVRAMYDLATVDAELTRSETDTLKRVVAQFNLAEEQLQQITKQFFGNGDAHFRTLGLGADASDDEIRAAFRKLAAENHPDRVASLGAKEAEAASNRFRQVKDAYEALRKLRGF